MALAQRILVPVDGGPLTERALDFAIERARPARGTLSVVYVVDVVRIMSQGSETTLALDPTPLLRAVEQEGDAILADAARYVKERGAGCVTKRLEGQPTQAIVDYAAANRIDCIVMGTHGRDGLERFFLGSTAEGVLRSGSLPTYLIRASDPSPASRAMPLSRLLVALDHSEPGGAAVAAAIELAIAEHGCIHFCHVLDTRHELNSAFTAGYDPTRIIDQMRVEATLLVDAAISKAHALGIVADGAIVEGEPAAKIIAAVEEFSADIVVLGTHGRTGLQRFFIGSVAETVIRHAPAPALVIRAKRPLPIEVPATRLVERAL